MIYKETYVLISVLIGITLICFFPTFNNDFQRGWDDTWQVLENPFVADYDLKSIKYHFINFYYNQYSPVNTLFYMFVFYFFGYNAMAFHVMSLIIHMLNVLLVYFIVRDVTADLSREWTQKGLNVFSFLVSLIFAVHPLQVESVAWISASKVVLYTFFTLIAIRCYIWYIKSLKWEWFIIVCVTYFLGFASKEQAIILPLTLIVFDYVFDRIKGINFNKNFFLKRVVIEKILLFSMALLFWYFSVSNKIGDVLVDNGYPLYQRFLMSMHSVLEYIFRFIAPIKLYYFYFFPIEKGEPLPLYYWVYVILILIIGRLIWEHYKKGNKLVVFGFLFFIVNISLVLHILPIPRNMITADRYMYMSIIGLSIIGIWYVNYFYSKYVQYRKSIAPVFLIYFLFLSTHTFIRTQDWKDSERIKKNIKELVEKRKASNKVIISKSVKK